MKAPEQLTEKLWHVQGVPEVCEEMERALYLQACACPSIRTAPRSYKAKPLLPARPWYKPRVGTIREWLADVAIITGVSFSCLAMATVISGQKFLPLIIYLLFLVNVTEDMRQRRKRKRAERIKMACQRFNEWISKAKPIN